MTRACQAIAALAAASITRGALTGHLSPLARLTVLALAACIVALIIGLELIERRPPVRKAPR